ncbi:sigma-70 family RNA polymerase sigma factor [Actinoplanes sp. NPDC051470]|uniref:RNA polymerase sigma factor n=1 Tax=unclassified Actinoplanes TaxID=2626549 RepID=UPI0034456189
MTITADVRTPTLTIAETSVTALLTRASAGDQGAWRTLISRYDVLLWAVARSFRLSHAQAADIVQTTWMLLVEHKDRIRDPERLPAWLSRTARNLCIAAVHRNARELPLIEDMRRQAPDDDPEQQAVRAEHRAMIRRALARLPERDRRLLELLVNPAVDYAYISKAMDMPIGSIGPTRQRALRRLREELRAGDLVDAALQ